MQEPMVPEPSLVLDVPKGPNGFLRSCGSLPSLNCGLARPAASVRCIGAADAFLDVALDVAAAIKYSPSEAHIRAPGAGRALPLNRARASSARSGILVRGEQFGIGHVSRLRAALWRQVT